MKIHTQKGVGLIEVMVALFVLSVGLLGVAGLQATGVRAGHSATLRSVAVLQAVEIIERMRVNPRGVNDGTDNSNYNVTAGDLGVNNNCEKQSAAASATCSPAQMAQHDIWEWKQSLLRAFPNMTPTGTITVTPAPLPSNVVVSINWVERGDPKTYTTQVQIYVPN